MKRTITASVWREGEWYVAQALDVDVASQGESVKDALANLREALELYFKPPMPKTLPKLYRVEVDDFDTSSVPADALVALSAVGDAAESAGVEPYLVGGAARDWLLGRETADFDVALVGADMAAFNSIASRAGGIIEKRSQFNTVRLALGGLTFDLAMARLEEYPSPGSLPVVRPADSMRRDLDRRDFSINAIAVSLSTESWGKVLDPRDGRADLSAGVIRALHPESFRDDPTRIFRAARYSARLDMTPDSDTLGWIRGSTQFIARLSPARVRNELELIFEEASSASMALALLYEWGALAAIHPALRYIWRGWNRFPDETDRLSRRKRVDVAYALLCLGVSDSDANAIANRLRPNGASRRAMRDAATVGRIPAFEFQHRSNSEVAALLDPLCEPAIRGASLVAEEAIWRRISTYLSRYSFLKPHLTGDHLISMGAPRGPEIGRILDNLRAARIDGTIKTIDEERKLAAFIIRTGVTISGPLPNLILRDEFEFGSSQNYGN